MVALLPLATLSAVGLTVNTGAATVTATFLDVILSLIVTVVDPAATPLTVVIPLAYLTVAMDVLADVTATVPDGLVTLTVAVFPTLTVKLLGVICKELPSDQALFRTPISMSRNNQHRNIALNTFITTLHCNK
jgi:hypothetical protein